MDRLPSEAVAPSVSRQAELEALRLMVGGTSTVLCVLDERCQVLSLNRRACELFIVEDSFAGSLADLAGSADMENLVNEALINQEQELQEQLYLNGKWWRVRIQMGQVAEQGRLICLSLEDVSQLVRLNRARRDMVANISHELRTPIANIRMIIDSLFLDNEKPGRKSSIRSLRAIARETDALQWMSEELLDLSMIESGQALMKMVDTQACAVVDDAIERLADMSAARKVPIVQKVPSDLYVLCDPDKLGRVLVNLLHNALKWSPPGKKIRVEARREGDEIRFGVLDRGEGVPQEHTSRIFERFYQADPSRVMEGTGLGLAICRHIIEAHGGSIRAESNQVRQGGRFYFTVPAGERP